MTTEVIQEFFSIGEVCLLTGVKAHVLRYWEAQFRFLRPAKNRSGNRVYQRREIELILLVKNLLYIEKYTIEGARIRMSEQRSSGEARSAGRVALTVHTLAALENQLESLVGVLDHAGSPTVTPAGARSKTLR